jgi:hypothetical protein
MFKKSLKTIAAVITVLFTTNTIVFSSPEFSYLISMPERFGKVNERWKQEPVQSEKRSVIIVQDAHDNFGAQKNISRILQWVIEHDVFDQIPPEEGPLRPVANRDLIVGIEGASQEIDLSYLRKYPFQAARTQAAQELMQKGYLTGSEHAAIVARVPFALYGVEDKKLFEKDFKAFHHVLSKNEQIKEFLTFSNRVIRELKKQLYTGAIAEVDTLFDAFQNDTIDLASFFAGLFGPGQHARIDLYAYHHSALFNEILAEEKKIETLKLSQEITRLIQWYETHDSEALSLLPFRDIDAIASDHTALAQLWNSHIRSPHKAERGRFPFIRHRVALNRKYGLLDFRRLSRELVSMVHEIKEKNARTDEQRLLNECEYRLALLEDILLLQAGRDTVSDFFREKQFSFTAFNHDISRLAETHGLEYPFRWLPMQQEFERLLTGPLKDFYGYAEKREAALVDNLLKKMEQHNKTSGVLVVGGYHTEGVTKILKAKHISYAVVRPHIARVNDHTGYLSRMLGELLPLSPYLISHIDYLSSGDFFSTASEVYTEIYPREIHDNSNMITGILKEISRGRPELFSHIEDLFSREWGNTVLRDKKLMAELILNANAITIAQEELREIVGNILAIHRVLLESVPNGARRSVGFDSALGEHIAKERTAIREMIDMALLHVVPQSSGSVQKEAVKENVREQKKEHERTIRIERVQSKTPLYIRSVTSDEIMKALRMSFIKNKKTQMILFWDFKARQREDLEIKEFIEMVHSSEAERLARFMPIAAFKDEFNKIASMSADEFSAAAASFFLTRGLLPKGKKLSYILNMVLARPENFSHYLTHQADITFLEQYAGGSTVNAEKEYEDVIRTLIFVSEIMYRWGLSTHEEEQVHRHVSVSDESSDASSSRRRPNRSPDYSEKFVYGVRLFSDCEKMTPAHWEALAEAMRQVKERYLGLVFEFRNGGGSFFITDQSSETAEEDGNILLPFSAIDTIIQAKEAVAKHTNEAMSRLHTAKKKLIDDIIFYTLFFESPSGKKIVERTTQKFLYAIESRVQGPEVALRKANADLKPILEMSPEIVAAFIQEVYWQWASYMSSAPGSDITALRNQSQKYEALPVFDHLSELKSRESLAHVALLASLLDLKEAATGGFFEPLANLLSKNVKSVSDFKRIWSLFLEPLSEIKDFVDMQDEKFVLSKHIYDILAQISGHDEIEIRKEIQEAYQRLSWHTPARVVIHPSLATRPEYSRLIEKRLKSEPHILRIEKAEDISHFEELKKTATIILAVEGTRDIEDYPAFLFNADDFSVFIRQLTFFSILLAPLLDAARVIKSGRWADVLAGFRNKNMAIKYHLALEIINKPEHAFSTAFVESFNEELADMIFISEQVTIAA